MKALQIVAPGRTEIVEIDKPKPAAGEILIKVEAAATCPQWDLHLLSGADMFPGRPLVYPYMVGQPGHEAVGTVEAAGPGVTMVAPGDRIATWRDGGHHRLGCYAEYFVRGEEEVLKIPAAMERERVASLELAMCVRVSYEALEKLGGVKGKRVGVSGLGPAGLVAVQMAKAAGAAEVVGYDLVPERRDFALKFGADATFDPREVAPLETRHDDGALDMAIDCVGRGSSVQFLMDRTREAVSIFGTMRDDVTFGWKHWSGLALLGYTFNGARPNHNRGAAEFALKQIESGALDLRPLVSATMPLAEYDRGVQLLREQRAMKVCFLP